MQRRLIRLVCGSTARAGDTGDVTVEVNVVSLVCHVCQDCTWVCEAHSDVAYGKCPCGADGVFCPHCAPIVEKEGSELPTAFTYYIHIRRPDQN